MEPAATVCLTFRPLFSRGFRLKTGMPAPPPKKKKKKNRKQSKAKKDRGESTGKQEENAGDSQNSAGSAPKIRRQALGEPTNLLLTAVLGSTGEKKSGYFINRFLVCKSRRSKSAAPGQPPFVSGPSRHRARARPGQALGRRTGSWARGKTKIRPRRIETRAPSVKRAVIGAGVRATAAAWADSPAPGRPRRGSPPKKKARMPRPSHRRAGTATK